MILAEHFPPVGGAGAQRPTKFGKYLMQLGWEVCVVTQEISEHKSRWKPKDNTFEHDLNNGGKKLSIIRVGPVENYSFTKAIDGAEAWSVAAGQAACKELSQTHYDAVLLTMSPFSLVRAADVIRAQSDVPIILDFRDPWALDGWQPQKTFLHWRHQYNEMRTAVLKSDGVIANTKEAGKLILKHFPEFDANRLVTIENGYDSEDFVRHNGHEFSQSSDNIFTLLFTGSLSTDYLDFYSGLKGFLKLVVKYTPEKIDYSGRTLIYLMKAINLLRQRNDPIGDMIRIECLGAETEADRKSVIEAGLEDAVVFHGYIPHAESVQRILDADGLFLPLHGLEPGERSRIVPGKTYEYLATGKPILGCLPQGDARDLVEKSSVGVTADPCDPEQIADALKELITIARKLPSDNPPETWVANYERKALTGKLADFVTQIC